MENTPWFGNDDDEVDMLARKCGQIYSYEVEKYKNPRGGQFQAGCYDTVASCICQGNASVAECRNDNFVIVHSRNTKS